jgi:hypothetical protein
MPSEVQNSPETVVDSATESIDSPLSLSRLRVLAYLVILGTGFLRAWVGRYSISPDGMCYLDLGDAFIHRKWFDAVNALWSPLYAWLLGAALFLTQPSRWIEFPVAHAVNFLIYVVALLSFEYFLRTVDEGLRGDFAGADRHCSPLSQTALYGLGYALFLWSSLDLITIWELSPDLLVAGFVYLIAGMLLRLRTRSTRGTFVLLGAVLALAYLTKAVMFPLGFAFILVGVCLVRPQKRSEYLVVVTICFLLLSAPWIFLLSRAKERFTFSDAGSLNYSSQVSPGGRVINWQGIPAASGVPKHPTRKLLDNPPLYEFAAPVGGTFPPSFDPTYWNEGRRWTFSIRAQARVILEGILVYAGIFLRDQSGVLAAALALILIGGAATRKAIARNWPLLVMTFVPLGLYALVNVETRYVAGYVILFWMALLAGVRLREVQQKAGEYLALAAVVTVLFSVGDTTVHAVRAMGPYSARNQVDVAEGLERMQIKSGDEVAVLGDGNWAYWARLGQLKIVSTIMANDAPTFWSCKTERKDQVYRLFASTGAKVVVTNGPLAPNADAGWQQVGTTEYYVHSLPH